VGFDPYLVLGVRGVVVPGVGAGRSVSDAVGPFVKPARPEDLVECLAQGLRSRPLEWCIDGHSVISF
jgi:hypothetical protein